MVVNCVYAVIDVSGFKSSIRLDCEWGWVFIWLVYGYLSGYCVFDYFFSGGIFLGFRGYVYIGIGFEVIVN